MGKMIKLKNKRNTVRPNARRYDAVKNGVSLRRSRRSNGLKGFLRRYYKLVAIAGAVLVIGVLCLVLFLGGRNTTTSEQIVETTPTLPIADESYDYSDVDKSTLAGLAGTDESLFSDDEELADALFAEEGIRIGVTVGSIESSDQEFILNRLEQVSNAAETDKTIFKTYYCNANGDYNQQLQDVRSLIKNEVDVMIVGFTDEESFKMISMMAENAGIPMVAFNAPVDSGYAINVVADQSAWGSVYGKFVTDHITEGNVVQILGRQDSAIDAERAQAIRTALATNVNLLTSDAIYAEWDEQKAQEAMAEYLKDGVADAVITEEGMAEGILDAFIEQGVLPKVMCGDATAGFIKKWYALKNGGIDVTPAAEDNGDSEDTAMPTPTLVMFTAKSGEFIVCAQPAPTGIGAAAFSIALEMAKGRTLIEEGQTYNYTVGTLITDANLDQYYEQVKDKDDSFIVSDLLADDVLDTLLNPLEEQTAETASAELTATVEASEEAAQTSTATVTVTSKEE